MQKVKLIIADDQVLFLKGLRLLIQSFESIQLVAEAQNGVELLQAIDKFQPDVVLVDLKMPVMDGIEATAKIKEKHPEVKVLLLSMYHDESIINHVIRIGANGYLLKNEEPDILKEAIETVAVKDFYFCDYVSQAMVKGLRQPAMKSETSTSSNNIILTQREKEVLKLICKEYTSSEISNQLFISIRTVEGHRKNLLGKTGARNTAGLVLYAIKNQLVDY